MLWGNPHRAEIANFLLDEGADASIVEPESYNCLHVLIGRLRLTAKDQYDPTPDLALMRRLVDGGADVNQVSKRSGTPLQYLWERSLAVPEKYVVPFYELFFARPDLDLLKMGHRRSTFESIRLNAESFPVFYGLCVQYLTDHGIAVPVDGEG